MINDNDDLDQLIETISLKRPDLVEFRLDNVSDLTVIETLAQKKRFTAVVADKAKRDPEFSQKLVKMAAISGFEYFDFDVSTRPSRSLIQGAKSLGAKIVVSFHDLTGTPSTDELRRVLALEQRFGGDVCKIVTTANNPRDNLTILSFVAENASKSRLVSFAMGRFGKLSRILSPLFGAEFTFAALTQESTTAQGQLSIDDLRAAWQLLGIQ